MAQQCVWNQRWVPNCWVQKVSKSWCKSFPYHPWDWYIFLHEWLIFMVNLNVGNYTIHGWYVFFLKQLPTKILLDKPSVDDKNRNPLSTFNAPQSNLGRIDKKWGRNPCDFFKTHRLTIMTDISKVRNTNITIKSVNLKRKMTNVILNPTTHTQKKQQQ